jgi:ribonucleoside-diphosphate reductase beta chain
LARMILVNVVVEGIFFTGSFAAITWIHSFYNKMSGLALANEWISRDEGMHTEFGIMLYNKYIVNKLPETLVYEIIREAVEIESDFMSAALPTGLLGMNAELMAQYIQFVADQLLVNLNYKKIYNSQNPFGFMNKQSTSVRSGDFFIKTVSDYAKSSYDKPIDAKLDFGEEF